MSQAHRSPRLGNSTSSSIPSSSTSLSPKLSSNRRLSSSNTNSRNPSRESSPSRRPSAINPPPPFDLRLPLASPSTPTSRNNPSSSSGGNSSDSFGRGITLLKNSIRMSTKRGNRYVLGAALVLTVFGFWHISHSGAGSTSPVSSSSRETSWSKLGLWPSEKSWGSSSSHAGSVNIDTYINLDALNEIPETEYVKGVAGFSYFKNLYLFNGTFIAISSDPSSIPEAAYIMSAHPTDDNKNPPAGLDRWQVLIPGKDDLTPLGGVAVRKEGISAVLAGTYDVKQDIYVMFFNDEKGLKSVSFLKHYFHFIGEVFLGAWRVLATAGEKELPTRLMYRTTPDDWRDRAGLTAWFQQSVMPNTAVEESPLWEDRQKSGMTFLFEKITITDRWAAHQKGIDPYRFNKMTADLLYLDPPLNWMDPLRLSMKRLVQTKNSCSVYRKNKDVPIVLYINRQLTGRRLIKEDAEDLEKEMEALGRQGEIEWINAQMENLSRVDQFCLALKADIIMGVHGNGLSHALWMKPGSAVLEFMFPGGFARDYASIAEFMSHDYYSIHNDTIFTKDKWLKDNGWGVGANPGFHGNAIPLNGKYVAGLIRKIAQEKKSMVEP